MPSCQTKILDGVSLSYFEQLFCTSKHFFVVGQTVFLLFPNIVCS